MGSKFGLDYLIKTKSATPSSAQTATDQATELVERATTSLGREILSRLQTLKDSGRQGCQINDLVDALNVDRDTLGPVVARMADLSLLEVNRDRYGNHFLSITPTGEESLNLASP